MQTGSNSHHQPQVLLLWKFFTNHRMGRITCTICTSIGHEIDSFRSARGQRNYGSDGQKNYTDSLH